MGDRPYREKTFDELIERSSLGSDEVMAERAKIPPWARAELLGRVTGSPGRGPVQIRIVVVQLRRRSLLPRFRFWGTPA